MTDKELIDLISENKKTKELGITKIIQKRYAEEEEKHRKTMEAAEYVRMIAEGKSILGPHMLLDYAYDALEENDKEENSHA